MERILPIGVVLTISASGSETSDTAVLTHDETLVKRGLGSDLLRPKFAILDPELTYTLPPYQVSCGVVDIMMHTLDRYFTSVTGNLLTDEIAEGLLRTVITCGTRAHKNSRDAQAMSELMWAGSLSHNDLTGLGPPRTSPPTSWVTSSAPGSTSPTGPPCPPFGAAGRPTAGKPTPPASPSTA